MEDYVTLSKWITGTISTLLWFIIISFIVISIVKIWKWVKLHRNDCCNILKEKIWAVFMSISIIISVIIIFLIIIQVFNNGKFTYIENRNISTNWESWGAFATCFASFFALISIYWIYKSFRSQVTAVNRASFDATFTQAFAQHHILFDKVKCSKSNHCHFAEFRTFYKKKTEKEELLWSNSDIWEAYNTYIEENCGKECPSNFRNFFKYIHREVTFIQGNFKDSWGIEAKKQYVRLIEGQMNNDELFSYFINQLDYCEKHWEEKQDELQKYLTFLRDNDFFKEICEETNAGYRQDVITAIRLFRRYQGVCIQKYIVKQEWLK